MTEKPYANREIDEKFKNLDTLIREKHDDVMIKMGEIVVQTTKTNGKVRRITLWLAVVAALAIGMGINNGSVILSLLGL